MKKNLLLKVASALLSSGMLISLIPSAVLADGDTITVDGHDFVRQSDGLYKCSLTMYEYWAGSAHPYTYVYCLLTQDIIDNDFGGTIPSVENPTQQNLYYYLGENVTLRHGVKVKEHSGAIIELQGRTITYDPEDTSEYLWDASGIMSCSVNFQGSYFQNESSSQNGGKISSPNGAPIAKLDGEGDRTYGSIQITGINVVGGYGTNYDDMRYSAIDLSGYAELYIGVGGTISSFSAEQGGAVYATGNTEISVSGKITNCYAIEGGGIYSAGRVLFGGQMTGNIADKRGGAICLIGDNARFQSDYSLDEMYPLPSITNNTSNSYEGADEGGGGIYVDSGHERPVFIDNQINIYNNNRSGGNKKNLHIVCDDGTEDYISADYYNDVTFKVGVSAYGAKDGDPLIRVPGYSKSVGVSYYTDRFIYEAADNSALKSDLYTNPEDDKNYRLDFCYVSDKKNTTVLSGYSLITDGSSIGIKFYVYFSDADRNLGLDRFTATVSTVGDNKCYILGDNEKTLTYRDLTSSGSYYAYTYYVDSMDMTVPLKFDLYKSGKEEPVASMSGFTVRDYIDAVIKNPIKYGESGVKMATCLALYGAASQKYFKFRSDDLADLNITEDMKSKATLSYYQNSYKNTVFYDPSDTQDGTNMPFNISPSEHLSFYGWTMSFKGKPAVKFFFLPEEGVTVDDLYLYSYPDNKKIYTKGKYIVIEIYDLTMEQVTRSSHVTIYYGEDYETELEINFKPINYITRMMKNENNTEAADELFNSFYLLAMQFLPYYYENYIY